MTITLIGLALAAADPANETLTATIVDEAETETFDPGEMTLVIAIADTQMTPLT